MSHQVSVFGKISNEVESRFTASGKQVVNVTVSDSRRVRGPDGEQKTEYINFRLSLWERTAEFAQNHLKKGDWVQAIFTLQHEPRVWEATDGTSRASYESQFVHSIEKAWLPRNEDPTPEPLNEDEVPF